MPLYILRFFSVGLLGYYRSAALKVYCIFQNLAKDHFKIFCVAFWFVGEFETEIEAVKIPLY